MSAHDVPVLQSRLTRRTFISGAAAVSLLAACSTQRSPSSARSARGLKVLSWTDYIDTDFTGSPGTVTRFQQASGLAVTYSDAYPSNTEAYATLFAPNLGHNKRIDWDVVVPTFWLASRLVDRGWLEPIPVELVPNHVNVEPNFLTMPWDRGARYNMPWQSGLTGIAYDPALTGGEVRSLAALFDPKFKGRVGLVREMRETVALTMAMQGADPSRPTRAGAEKALDALDKAVSDGQIREFTGNEFRDRLADGSFALCLAWSGDSRAGGWARLFFRGAGWPRPVARLSRSRGRGACGAGGRAAHRTVSWRYVTHARRQ